MGWFFILWKLFSIFTKNRTIMEKAKLTRSNNKVIAGVCAGIAEWLGWDINTVRIIYILASLISAAFPGILVYVLLWIVMPDDDMTISYK